VTLSFVLHNKEAKLLPPDTFLSRKNAPGPAGGAYSVFSDPIASNEGGPPGKGEEKGEEGQERGEEWRGGKGEEG